MLSAVSNASTRLPIDLQEFLHTVISTADFVKTKKHSNKTIHISFDEFYTKKGGQQVKNTVLGRVSIPGLKPQG